MNGALRKNNFSDGGNKVLATPHHKEKENKGCFHIQYTDVNDD